MTKDSMFPEGVEEAASKLGGQWIKGEEFETSPIFQIAKAMEIVKPNNPKYGAKADNYLVKNEILEEGQTFHYTFKTPKGEERFHDSNSPALFIGMRQVEELGIGDWVKISRTGATTETRYTVIKVDASGDDIEISAF